jgi:hypothetical protein
MQIENKHHRGRTVRSRPSSTMHFGLRCR